MYNSQYPQNSDKYNTSVIMECLVRIFNRFFLCIANEIRQIVVFFVVIVSTLNFGRTPNILMSLLNEFSSLYSLKGWMKGYRN